MEEQRYPIGEFNRRDSLDEVTLLVPSCSSRSRLEPGVGVGGLKKS